MTATQQGSGSTRAHPRRSRACLLLGKRDNQESRGGSRTSHSVCRAWGSAGALAQVVPVKHP